MEQLFNLAKFIKISEIDLESWIDNINYKLDIFKPTGVFSGISTNNSDIIPIPLEIRFLVTEINRPYLYKNGLLEDPNTVSFIGICPTAIQLTGKAILNKNDKFVIFIKP